MPKLKLKRTPEEEAAHQERKALRKEKKRKRSEHSYASSSKRAHKDTDDDVTQRRKWASSDEDDISAETTRPSKPGHGYPRGSSFNPDRMDDDVRDAEMEEEMFRDRLFGALGEDERLDGLESHLNDFVHVPDRWRNAAAGSSEKVLYEEDDFLKLNPTTLDDDEYAEWIRLGMYRKSHAAEHAENVRRKAAAAERRAAEKARKAESRRLEKEAEEERRRKKKERELAKKSHVKDEYHVKWKVLLGEANGAELSERPLEFDEIPWPIYHPASGVVEEDFTKDTISTFLLAGKDSGDKKTRKDILRETFLRFHPDKFEGRFMRRVKESDQEKVREAIQQISRVLNHLLEGH
ncbi:hypothetical protein D9611_000288 [Ephemerocybe angulata]|uniref:NF-kappa-B inhibitor-like protein 1 n=1 Tax=Ephemerocybe angulata TaxID=980116 RepID=A0A8H5BMY0_9AGAR|nr:hypothetical protein D9611_000288 [Tulosesus angulatus]